LCEDGLTEKQDEDGTNCPDIVIDDPEGLEECPEGQFRNAEGNCVSVVSDDPEAEECENGADDWPLCSECADGSRPDPEYGCTPPVVEEPEQGPEEECPEGTTEDPETGECIPSGVDDPESGGGGGGGGGMMASPFMTGLNYQLPEIQPLVLPQAPSQPRRANDLMGGLLTKMIMDRNN
jgi:hypothetical protein